MKTFNPDKLIAVDIYAPIHQADGYVIWDARKTVSNRHVITRNADEDQITELLSEKQYKDFESGDKFTFNVPAGKLTDLFQYLY